MNKKRRKNNGRLNLWGFEITKSTNNKVSRFTLVEVTMSIAIISIGMMGVIALFPVGFQATRDAMGDNYSSEMADQFLHLIKMQCSKYDGNGVYTPSRRGTNSDEDGNGIPDYDGWGEWLTGRVDKRGKTYTAKILTAKPSAERLDVGNVYSTAELEADGILESSMLFGDSDNDGWDDAGIYLDKPLADIDKGVFYVEARSGDNVDWDGVMYIWREPLRYDNGTEYADLPYDFACRLCIEISWPFAKPYEYRRKRVYALEIFNQVPRAGF